MSKKETNGKISYNQYRLTDLLLFLLIMAVCEAVNIFAIKSWFPNEMVSISVMMLITLIVMVRWNWWAAAFPVIDGVLFCFMCSTVQDVNFSQYVIYGVGNAFIVLNYFFLKLVGKDKVIKKWYLTIVYALIGYVLVVLGRSVVSACFGENFLQVLVATAGFGESVNLLFAILGLLILRRLDGMLEDQKQYLIRINQEQNKKPQSDFWEGYAEIDESELDRVFGVSPYKNTKSQTQDEIDEDLSDLDKLSAEDILTNTNAGNDAISNKSAGNGATGNGTANNDK